MPMVEQCTPQNLNAFLRFSRECQIAAGAFLPPTDAAHVLPAVWAAMRAAPHFVEGKAPVAFSHVLLQLARHTLDQSWRSSNEFDNQSRDIRPCVIKALDIMFVTDRCKSLSLSGLAAGVSVSRWHLCRNIRTVTGYSFVTHLSGLRVLTAMSLLADRNLNVKATAALTGYHHTSELDRNFKRWVHMSPTSFRQTCSKL
jgi:AraC-like DNA-binding protein